MNSIVKELPDIYRRPFFTNIEPGIYCSLWLTLQADKVNRVRTSIKTDLRKKEWKYE